MIKWIKKYLIPKKKEEYIPYGMCPGFYIKVNDSSWIQGHMVIKKSDNEAEIRKKFNDLIVKFCKERNLSKEETEKNLKNNNLDSYFGADDIPDWYIPPKAKG